MGHTYQKGSKRPGRTDNPSRHDHGRKGYTLSGGVPWPEFGDGTPYADRLKRVSHAELTQETGTLQWVEWCHPGGQRMADGDRQTKTKTPKTRPGEWWAVVSWDRRDQHDSMMARHPLKNLVPLDPGT